MFSKTQLALCQSNDSKSQRDLYTLFKGKVMGLCRRYSWCKEEAEDVFQETFIRVFKNIDQVHDAEHLEQWIKKIVSERIDIEEAAFAATKRELAT